MRAAKNGKQDVAPRFDPAALRGLAGDAVFRRGEDYARAGRVELLSDDGTCLRARIIGAEAYRAALRGRGGRFAGECSCPALVHKSADGHGAAAIAAFQAMRCDTGMPSLVLRLSTAQATRSSDFWAGGVRARRPRPMIALQRNTAVSPSDRLP
jgi:hypothetical protein